MSGKVALARKPPKPGIPVGGFLGYGQVSVAQTPSSGKL
jgi:hypothetical protein